MPEEGEEEEEEEEEEGPLMMPRLASSSLSSSIMEAPAAIPIANAKPSSSTMTMIGEEGDDDDTLKAQMAAMLAGLDGLALPSEGGRKEDMAWEDLTHVKPLSDGGACSVFTAVYQKEIIIAKVRRSTNNMRGEDRGEVVLLPSVLLTPISVYKCIS